MSKRAFPGALHSGWAVVLGALLSSCGAETRVGGSPASPSDVARVPPVLAGLRVFVPRPGWPGPENPRAAQMMTEALESGFREGGFEVVPLGAPHDVVATLWMTALQLSAPPDGHLVESFPHTTITVDCRANDGSNTRVSTSRLFEVDSQGVSDDCGKKWAKALVAHYIAQIGRSQSLAQIGLGRSGIAVAHQTAPPPHTAPSPAPVEEKPQASVPTERAFTSATPQPGAFALVIGIEKYRDAPAPKGARNDAERFARFARQTLGIPESNIVVALDDRAAKSDMEKNLDWLKSNVQAGSRVYFFFSGHGAPEPSKGTSYLLPYDGDPRFLERTALPMADVLRSLSQTKAREVLAIVDTCFSGAGGRSVLPPGARALVRVQTAPAARTVALLSASSGAEISGPVAGGDAGLFTQHVLDGLGHGRADINGDGQISLQELTDYVKPRVSREAKRENRDQNPSLTMGAGVGAAESFIVEWGLAGK